MAFVFWTEDIDPTRCPTCGDELGPCFTGRGTGKVLRHCRDFACGTTLVLPAQVQEPRDPRPLYTPELPYLETRRPVEGRFASPGEVASGVAAQLDARMRQAGER